MYNLELIIMKELVIDALVDNLGTVTAFIDEQLEEAGCSMKVQMQVDIAVEEIFVNIAHYAYKPETGSVKIKVNQAGEGRIYHVHRQRCAL